MPDPSEPIRLTYNRLDAPPADGFTGYWQCLHCQEAGYIVITDAPDFDTALDLLHEGQERVRAEHIC